MKEKTVARTVRTFCSRMCSGSCGIRVTVKEGKAVKIEGDPESPINRGVLCPKGVNLLELLYHPDRLRFPQKRVGERGEGKWQRISWDEALSTIAARLQDIKQKWGSESIVLGIGTPKGLELAFVHRFASVFGLVNIISPGHICHMPRELASTFTCGASCIPDYEHPPACLVVWGSNPLQTNEGGITRVQLRPALDKEIKLLVIDPRKNPLASRADLWLKPRPASDGFLALGMIKVIVEENLCDADFVSKWTVGFDQLKEHIKTFPLERIEEITWVPREQVEQAARLYATTKPAAIQWGNALEHNSNSFQTLRAIAVLRALAGNIDIPGGDIFPPLLPLTRPADFMLLREFPRNRAKMIGKGYKIALNNLFVPSQLIVQAILEERPYPVKALLLFGSNPLLTYANALETRQALSKLDFLAVSEFFMTPTAALADIVLPAAMPLEFDEIGNYGRRYGVILCRPQAVEPLGECWSDMKVVNELAKKLGLGEYFWKDVSEALDYILKPSGLTFADLRHKGIIRGKREYRKHEKEGFRTPSGKVEIYSSQLKELGYEPLPVFAEPPETPQSCPELTKEYPLVLTSAKSPYFFHSAYRNVASLRRISAEPLVEINPAAAARRGIKEGDWVYIETARGKIRQKARLNADIDPRVAIAAYGWWFPERGEAEGYGWKESNINVLTRSEPPYEPAIGSTNLRGMLCQVSKAE